MRPLGSILNGPVRPRDEFNPAEIEHDLIERVPWPAARLAADLDQARREGDERVIARLERDLGFAEWRERVQATRPPGCWCLGIGGHGRVGEPTPDGEGLLAWRVWCACPDGLAMKEAVLARRAVMIRERQQQVLDRLYGSLPDSYRAWTLDSLGKLSEGHLRLAKRLLTWLDQGENLPWLYLHGQVGRGKTGAAVGALRALGERSQTALYTDVSYLLQRLRQFGNPTALAEAEDFRWYALQQADVLLLDDLGAERHRRDEGGGVDWATEQIWLLISERHRRRARTLITSNHTLEQITDILGHPRISSRISELALVLDCSGLPNLRGQA